MRERKSNTSSLRTSLWNAIDDAAYRYIGMHDCITKRYKRFINSEMRTKMKELMCALGGAFSTLTPFLFRPICFCLNRQIFTPCLHTHPFLSILLPSFNPLDALFFLIHYYSFSFILNYLLFIPITVIIIVTIINPLFVFVLLFISYYHEHIYD